MDIAMIHLGTQQWPCGSIQYRRWVSAPSMSICSVGFHSGLTASSDLTCKLSLGSIENDESARINYLRVEF